MSFVASGSSAVEEHMPQYRNVVGSNPVRCWAFFSFYPLRKLPLNRSPWSYNINDFHTNGCLGLQKRVKQANAHTLSLNMNTMITLSMT